MADLVITPANVSAASTSPTLSGNAGEAITAGQVCFKSSTDNKIWLADADAVDLQQAGGIALNTAESADSPVRLVTLGHCDLGTVMTKGVIYVLSTTPGGIAPYADLLVGDTLVILGPAFDGNFLDIKIHNTGILMP